MSEVGAIDRSRKGDVYIAHLTGSLSQYNSPNSVMVPSNPSVRFAAKNCKNIFNVPGTTTVTAGNM